MAVAEITETTTPEEISAFVDELHEARTGDQAPPAKEPKTDAEIVNDVASAEVPEPKKTEAKTAAPKGDETAEAPKKGKGETADDRSWLDDDLKAEVSAYGIGDDELADFTSREEVERAMRLFDKGALEAGRKALADAKADGEPKEPGRDAQGRFVAKAADTETAAEPEKKPDAGGYEVKLSKDTYDDEIVDEFKRQGDFYKSKIDALEGRIREIEAVAEEQRFDSMVDTLGHPELFGTTGKETKEERQRRHDLFIDVEAYIQGRKLLGRPIEMSELLVSRLAKVAYAEQIGKKELKERTKRIAKQSNGRQGGGVTRPNDVPESPREAAARMFRELSGA